MRSTCSNPSGTLLENPLCREVSEGLEHVEHRRISQRISTVLKRIKLPKHIVLQPIS